MVDKPIVTRFAPSPSGYLHLGHAYSALFAAAAVGPGQGRFLLRIEDIDQGRCKPAFEDAIYEDLAWLGLDWERPVRRQSDHFEDYRQALTRLDGKDLLYPCFCTRTDIAAEIERAGMAPHDVAGPDGPLYPGTCRHMPDDERDFRLAQGDPFALRLKMEKACESAGSLTWQEVGGGGHIATPQIFGDVVLARKDSPSSYHLSVTVDDHLQGVTLVTRGEDLRPATHIHRLLQALLAYNVPEYTFHRMLTGEDGRRYAKRERSLTLRSLRGHGETPADVRLRIGV